MLMAIPLGSFGSTTILRNELLGTPRHLGVKIALCSRRRSADVPVSARGFSDCLGPEITSVPIYTDAHGSRRWRERSLFMLILAEQMSLKRRVLAGNVVAIHSLAINTRVTNGYVVPDH
jgi:hypothetical protein